MLYSRLVSSIKAPLSSWLPSFGNAPKTIESVEQMTHWVDVCKVPPHTVHIQRTGYNAGVRGLLLKVRAAHCWLL
jgi:hypothetical protein